MVFWQLPKWFLTKDVVLRWLSRNPTTFEACGFSMSSWFCAKCELILIMNFHDDHPSQESMAKVQKSHFSKLDIIDQLLGPHAEFPMIQFHESRDFDIFFLWNCRFWSRRHLKKMTRRLRCLFKRNEMGLAVLMPRSSKTSPVFDRQSLQAWWKTLPFMNGNSVFLNGNHNLMKIIKLQRSLLVKCYGQDERRADSISFFIWFSGQEIEKIIRCPIAQFCGSSVANLADVAKANHRHLGAIFDKINCTWDLLWHHYYTAT